MSKSKKSSRNAKSKAKKKQKKGDVESANEFPAKKLKEAKR